ncbi:hypothetical protein COCNU_09G009580 [Cocos nucifera]|uniref:Uncharacterized protein n=1 Tax=Cocos nucifera TaxID=13894 RepID=A0A8K0IMB1_COCNU|nr:hypothetical protein COCNU_09G009580 [Cocos nucifera]
MAGLTWRNFGREPMTATLKRLSAQRLQDKILPAQTRTFRSFSAEVPKAPLTSSPPIPDDVEGDRSLSRSDLQNSMGNVRVESVDSMKKNVEVVTEATVKTFMKVIPIFSSMSVVLKMEANLSKESEGGAIKAYGFFNSTNALAHYLNRFIENIIDLSKWMMELEIQSTILRKAKDQLSKEVAKTLDRAEEVEKKILSTETALKKFVEENVRLIGINGALEVEIVELRDRVIKIEASEVEALLLVKAIEEKALKAVDNFRASDEFRKEKASFVLDAYDEEKHVVHEEIASKYSELDLSFLDIPSDNLS